LEICRRELGLSDRIRTFDADRKPPAAGKEHRGGRSPCRSGAGGVMICGRKEAALVGAGFIDAVSIEVAQEYR
jgi:hypothetical protein